LQFLSIPGNYFLNWHEKFEAIKDVLPKGTILRHKYQIEFANAVRYVVVTFKNDTVEVLLDNWTFGDRENPKIAYAVVPPAIVQVKIHAILLGEKFELMRYFFRHWWLLKSTVLGHKSLSYSSAA
jgi:hypothetical protein